MRIDFRLLAAVIAPLLVCPWIPPWDSSILEAGLTGAIIICISIAVVEEVIFRGGKRWDMIYMGILREQWEKLLEIGPESLQRDSG